MQPNNTSSQPKAAFKPVPGSDRIPAPDPRPITWRSVGLGLLGVVLISALTPYNDYVLKNTPMVGFNLPIGLVVLAFLGAILLNGPLSRFFPARALSSGELAVMLSMVLVASAIPSSGLMRYLPGVLVMPFAQSASRPDAMALLDTLSLPKWIYPDYQGSTPREWMTDPLVQDFVRRYSGDGPLPLAAWIRPMIAWGVFYAAVHGAVMCMIVLIRRQWYENERLPFPLAQIELSLIEQPKPGQWFNGTIGKKSFWIAFFAIFLTHSWNGLFSYWPEYFPELPVKFDLASTLSEAPWRYMDADAKASAVYFSAAGVSYFLPGAVSFSLWFFYVAMQVLKMILGTSGTDTALPGRSDQIFGGLLAYAVMILWIGRKHWVLILRQAFRGERPGEPGGRYLSYPVAFWGMIGCAAVMAMWLVAAGITPIAAIVFTFLLLLSFMLVARVIAETGLMHNGIKLSTQRPWELLSIAGLERPIPLQSFFVTSQVAMIHHDPREVFAVNGTHAVKVFDQAIFDHAAHTPHSSERKLGRKLFGLLFGSLVVAYLVSMTSMLWCEYSFAVTKQLQSETVNSYVAGWATQSQVLDPSINYLKNNYQNTHNPAVHVTSGAVVTGLLSYLRLRLAWWPLHPIGFLAVGTWPMGQMWFSIFLGWLVRTLVLRFGGAKMYVDAKSACIGAIVGEFFAAGFWLLLGVLLSSLGIDYRTMRILPD